MKFPFIIMKSCNFEFDKPCCQKESFNPLKIFHFSWVNKYVDKNEFSKQDEFVFLDCRLFTERKSIF